MEEIKGGIYFKYNGKFFYMKEIPRDFPGVEMEVLELCLVKRLTLKEAAEKLGYAPERLKQLKSKAIRRLKINRKLICI